MTADPQPVPDAALTAALAEARNDERAKVAEEVRAMTLAPGLTRRANVLRIADRIARGTS